MIHLAIWPKCATTPSHGPKIKAEARLICKPHVLLFILNMPTILKKLGYGSANGPKSTTQIQSSVGQVPVDFMLA